MANKPSLFLFTIFCYISFVHTLELKFQNLNNDIALSKKGGICFRVDDNQSISEYQQFADLFNKYSLNFSFAINLGEPLNSDYLSLIKSLQEDGHELMDHTPNHRTDYFNTIFDPKNYINLPGVSHVKENKICLTHENVDISKSSKNGIGDVINKFIISKKNGEYKDVQPNQTYVYLGIIDTLLRISNVYNSNSNDVDTIRFADLWWESIKLSQLKNIPFYLFDNNNIHLTEKAFEVLAYESIKLADYYNIQRPVTWIQPGGNQPRAHSYELKNSIGNSLNFIAGAVYPNPSIKTYNEYNDKNDKNFGMQWGDFMDDEWYLSRIKNKIADQIAKHKVLIGHSHFYNLRDGWSGYLKRVENILEWCKNSGIPVLTYKEWANVLYKIKPDPNTNIFPYINVDLDLNGVPDGFLPRSTTWKGKVDQNDGLVNNSSFSYVIDQKGLICGIEELGGIEKGENHFEIWAKGAKGNFIETIFNIGGVDYIYKFPAESSNWTRYSLKQSINGNNALMIPEYISLVDITIRCSDYKSGVVKVAGMSLSKAKDISTSYLTVTSPNGGENFLVGENYQIQWNYHSVSDIEIEYSTDNGGIWRNIMFSTVNRGYYNWTIPNTPSTKCLIKITDVVSGINDVSNSTFTISSNSPPPPNLDYLTVISPNGNENLSAGSVQQIIWSSPKEVNKVNLFFSSDFNFNNPKTATWTKIAYISNNGSYNWKVPNISSSQCVIRIKDGDNPSNVDLSDANFTISNENSPPPNSDYLTVISPNGNEKLSAGSVQQIIWSSPKEVNKVNLFFCSDFNFNNSQTATWTKIAYVENSGNFSWNVPNLSSSKCVIRIEELDNPSNVDICDANFTISKENSPPPPNSDYLTVVSPNGNENLSAGSVQQIIWSSPKEVNKVNLFFSSDFNFNNSQTATWTKIAYVENSGNFSWNVPNLSSSQCVIRIKDGDNPSNVDICDANFTISKENSPPPPNSDYLTLISPNGDENLSAGSAQQIVWSSPKEVNKVNLFFSSDFNFNNPKTATWTKIAYVENSGDFSWNVPNLSSSQCVIRIKDCDNPSNVDICDANFYISVNSSQEGAFEEIEKQNILKQNYPNPFNPITRIQFAIAESQNVKISIYNMMGEEIQVLADKQFCEGAHNIEFDGANLTSGIYIYRLISKDFITTRRMILLK